MQCSKKCIIPTLFPEMHSSVTSFSATRFSSTRRFSPVLDFRHPNSSHTFSPSQGSRKRSYPNHKGASNFIPIKAERHTRLDVQELVNRVNSVAGTQKLKIINEYTFQSISEFNHTLMALFASKEHEIALKLGLGLSCYDLELDSWSYSIMIRCYCKKDDPVEAKKVLDLMIEIGFQPNVATFTDVINSFCKRGRLQEAYGIYSLMRKLRCEPTINTYNCLLKGLCYVGRVEEANKLLQKIKKSVNKPDMYTYTAVMDGFCKVGRSDEAAELLQEALKMDLKPNAVVFNTLFNGYFKEGRPLEGIDLMKKMKEKDSNCVPDYISYCTLLHGLLKWGETRSALMIYKEIVSNGMDVDERLMNTLLRQLCRRSRKENDLLIDAHQLFDKMSERGSMVYPETHELMVEAFCIGKEMDKAVANLRKMIRLGYSPKSFTFNNVVKMLCHEGKLDDAMWILVVLYGENRLPNSIGYNAVMKELNKLGMKMAARVMYGAARKRGILLMHKPRF